MSGRRLYVGRLAASANREEVEKFFSTHGKLVDIRMMVGFCFLEYEELKVRDGRFFLCPLDPCAVSGSFP